MSTKTIERFDEYCIVKYNNVQSKIIFPTENNSHYLVGPHEDTDYQWYDTLNMYSIEKRPTEEKLLARLYKCIDKQNVIGITKETISQIANVPSVDITNISYYRMKERLTSYATTSTFLETEFAQNDNVKSLYNETIIANILVEEYLKCWENMKNLGLTLELINNNVFSWRLKFDTFTNQNLMEDLCRTHQSHGINYIEVDMFFHGKLYPNYPPVIRITKPTLSDRLSHRISNSKMTQLAYWTPSRSVMYIITRLQHLLNTYASVDFEENSNNTYSQILSQLTINLQRLSSFVDQVRRDDEIDKDENFISFNLISTKTTQKTTQKTTSKTTSKSNWKAGTGYGTSDSSNWDPKEYIKLQKEKDTNIALILGEIINNMYQVNPSEHLSMSGIIEKSLLISYIQQQFTCVSLLDVKSRLHIYKLCFNVVLELININTIYLFSNKYSNDSDTLYDTFVKLYEMLKITRQITETSDEQDSTDDEQYLEFELTMLNSIEIILIPSYQEYVSKIEKQNAILMNVVPCVVVDKRSQYYKTMYKLKFAQSEILNTNYKSDFKSQYEKALSSGTNFNNCKKRLRIELPTLKQDGSLPIDFDSSIFLRVDKSHPMVIRMLVTGPKDTPYDSSCMIFDFYTSETYPANCPQVKFMNHGGKRFNPNLYNCGKVCLSILGQSYVGPSASASEKWNETSNLLQVMVSIQSQILIEDPYFNEPGHENSIGTATGNNCTKSYNENIRQYAMKSAMLDLLENPQLYPQFEDVIINHFRLKRDYISQILDKWTEEASEKTSKNNFLTTSNKIKELMYKL